MIASSWRAGAKDLRPIFGPSILFWVGLLAVQLIFSELPLPPVIAAFPFVFAAILCSRYAALSVVGNYLAIARGTEFTRPRIGTTVLVGMCFGVVLFLSLIFTFLPTLLAGPDSLAGVLLLPLGLLPVVLTLPFFWAAYPYWFDGAGFIEGLVKGAQLIRSDPKGTFRTTLFALGLWSTTIVLPPAWVFGDVISKMSFAQAYLAAEAARRETA